MKSVTRKAKGESLFVRADKEDEAGNFRRAFRLMLAAAKLGDGGAQVNVGNYYADGKGVRRNRIAALYWYKRAYRRGDASAANNIAVLWRTEGKSGRALAWFFRAVALGDDEANLEIGKHYLFIESKPVKAIAYFDRVIKSNRVTEDGAEEAARLIRQAKERLKRVQ